jgi:hypothetical protein
VGKCRDDFDEGVTFTITGKGTSLEVAKTDFEAQRDKKLEEIKKKLKCSDDVCLPEGTGEDAKLKECRFDWAEVDEPVSKEIKRKLHIHRQERTRWEITQTFEAGCFCVGISDAKDK